VKQGLLAAALATCLSTAVFAQQPQGTQAAAPASAGMTEGEVRRVDKSTRKITVKHGEIKNLDMPPMTMVFGVAEPLMLDKIKQGDKVRFRATIEDGNFTITEIQAVPN
jgi:Cu/Ag efflux protein CusF